VAKKKPAQQRPRTQRSIIVLKGTEEFAGWLKGFSEYMGLQMTSTIDVALKGLAEANKYEEPMPKRRKV
jgi:small nuclear ribonucleoprotein (snRNP)-like protein